MNQYEINHEMLRAPLWYVSNITRFCQLRLNSDHMLQPSGEGEVKAGFGERLEGGCLPARLLCHRDILAEQVQGQDGNVEGVSRQLPFRSSWRCPLLTRYGCLHKQVIVIKTFLECYARMIEILKAGWFKEGLLNCNGSPTHPCRHL